jgi:hypothetical protein
MADRISGTASASLPRKQASNMAAWGARRDPVALQTSSASAVSEAAAGKSPLQAAKMACAFSSIGS